MGFTDADWLAINTIRLLSVSSFFVEEESSCGSDSSDSSDSGSSRDSQHTHQTLTPPPG